ncbi:cyclic pyranopterin monophosphate synthase subunit MoaA [Chitinophaga jiangningensis]|uniref:GTP 3',8-cyclase n=1 Tax=Chitinophaga jiangningensis TaxID=1419482 RepID=A0A1M6X3H2_9BACT|nr:GTP 3',8-cyclase MoaA [Chitinophaga jiangningensis]SHL00474.1 cyclic pyranopterin monophosphate synthase subunit MoaA [Chitinophaga jiangningensis]
MLQDTHNRIINYVRLSVTDRCNLRCTYCMPEKMQFEQHASILTDDEILRLMKLLAFDGVSKIRITGGEPFMRPGLITLLEKIKNIDGITDISITTNGVLTKKFIPALSKLGIHNINLSLDTLDGQRFTQITRRDKFAAVMDSFNTMLSHDMQVKVNMVVMENVNTDEIVDFAKLTEHQRVAIRYIEEMPFNGQDKGFSGVSWDYHRILSAITDYYPLEKLTDAPHSTSLNYKIPGFNGTIGVIPAYSRTFCGTCNRLRISATGSLKTCLYGNNMLNIRDLMRNHDFTDMHIRSGIHAAVKEKFIDGKEAEKHYLTGIMESMSLIGG